MAASSDVEPSEAAISAAEPNESGVEPAQTGAENRAITVIPSSEWKAQDTFSESLRSLSERRIATRAFVALASAGAKMLEDELRDARSDRRASDDRERRTLKDFYDEKQKAAVA